LCDFHIPKIWPISKKEKKRKLLVLTEKEISDEIYFFLIPIWTPLVAEYE